MAGRILFAGFVLSLLMAIPVAAQDPAPREVRDLIGVRASSGETQLKVRGYVWIKTEEGGDRKYMNWWKQGTRTCINVVTFNGRYDTINTVPAFDCNRNSDGTITGGTSGGASEVNVDDLIGGRAPSGEAQLKSRGFTFVDSTKNRMAYTWWFNANTSQCIMVVTNQGRYVDIIANQNKRCK